MGGEDGCAGDRETHTGCDQASSCVPSSIEIMTCHPAGRATVHVAELVPYSPRSALDKDDKWI